MYKLKTIARRSSLLGITAAFTAAAIFPAALVSANALTPLTERSLLLTSSAPGYVDTDGSGYSTANPNPAGDGVLGGVGVDTPYTFAPAGSGPNGKKSGQTFTFRLSSPDDIKGISFQYCTTAAGHCQAPGDNLGDARDGVYEEVNNEDGRETNTQAHPESRSDLDFVGTFAPALAAAQPAAGQFQVYTGDSIASLAAIDTTGWAFEKANLEDTAHSGDLTGKNNYVTLSHATGVTGLEAGDYVRVVFEASEAIYITNPGSGHFFVKINTYSANGLANMKGLHNEPVAANHNVIDGGVTVANVMTDSIHITTKVLETMSFSVGIENPDTINHVFPVGHEDEGDPNPGAHGTCEIISQSSTITGLTNNRLNLGNPNAEFSLETTKAWDVYSYWRLSSNSSGGATVYYSGNTLANTVGDEIKAIDGGTPAVSLPGTEQFGLGFVDVANGDHADTFSASFQAAVGSGSYAHTTPTSYPFVTVASQWDDVEGEGTGDFEDLVAQPVSNHYRLATGTIDNGSGGAGTAQFKFLPSSLMVPEPIASQDETVISCATAKMRYVGNIAPDTPAGVYTTKVNYLAAPQY